MKVNQLYNVVMFFVISLMLNSCNVLKPASESTAQERCKSDIHKVLESRAALLLDAEGGTYSLDYEKIASPEDWRTKKWTFELDELFALEEIDAKYFEYRQSLLDIKDMINNAQCVITMEDFKGHFRKPTQTRRSKKSIHYYYRMNSKNYPSCYSVSSMESDKYQYCRMFVVTFDFDEKFKEISTLTFAYQ